MTREESTRQILRSLPSAPSSPPAKLDRSRWEGCRFCIGFWNYGFCPECGRPLTEEAWAELERRINGGTAD